MKGSEMKLGTLALAAVLFTLAAPAWAQTPAQPYAGQQGREVKALSAEDIAGLLRGEGMGLAKAAELNGYPGPAHVLSLAAELNLTEAQRRQVQAVFDRMHTNAVALGAEIVDRERVLDRQFAEGELAADRLAEATTKIAELQGRLRAAHLTAHLETRPLLAPDQLAAYRRLRGYGGADAPHRHHHHG